MEQNKDIIIHTKLTGALDQIREDEENYWRLKEMNWARWVQFDTNNFGFILLGENDETNIVLSEACTFPCTYTTEDLIPFYEHHLSKAIAETHNPRWMSMKTHPSTQSMQLKGLSWSM